MKEFAYLSALSFPKTPSGRQRVDLSVLIMPQPDSHGAATVGLHVSIVSIPETIPQSSAGAVSLHAHLPRGREGAVGTADRRASSGVRLLRARPQAACGGTSSSNCPSGCWPFEVPLSSSGPRSVTLVTVFDGANPPTRVRIPKGTRCVYSRVPWPPGRVGNGPWCPRGDSPGVDVPGKGPRGVEQPSRARRVPDGTRPLCQGVPRRAGGP